MSGSPRFRILVLGLLAALVAACTGGGSATPSPSSSSGPVQALIKVGERPAVPLASDGAVWVPNTGDGTISRIDATTNRVTATLPIGNQLAFYKRDCEPYGSVHSYMVTSFHVRDCDLPSALASGAGAIWATRNDEQAVLRIDPTSRRVLASIPVGFVPFDMAASEGAVWVTGHWSEQLVRIDPATNQVVARLRLPGGPSGIAIGDSAVWVARTTAGQVSRIDPASNTVVATVTLDCPGTCYQGSKPLALVATSDAVWVRAGGDGQLVRIDPKTNQATASIDVGFQLGRNGQDHLAVFDGSVWVCGISLLGIDPQTNRVTRKVDLSATSVIAGFGSLWVTDTFGRVERLQPGRA